MRYIFVTLILIFVAPLTSVSAQIKISEKVKKSEKILVSVPVVVSDREGRYVPNLKEDDFSILQDGVEQKIAFFGTDDEPVSVALLLDTSGSTKESLEKIKEAAKDFIELLNPKDKCIVATFDAEINVLNDLTGDQKTLKTSLDKIRSAEREGTVMFSAVEQIAQKALAPISGRKVIVLLSDGKDFGSELTKDDLLAQLEESDVLIYSVFYQTGLGFDKVAIDADGNVTEAAKEKPIEKTDPPKKKKNYSILIPLRGDVFTEEEIKLNGKANDKLALNSLREMSDTTSGRFYLSDTPNLSRVFKKIAGELRQQYRLGFYQSDAKSNEETREINVKVKREDVVVRARGKYRAKKL